MAPINKKPRIYLVTMGDVQKLIRASSRALAVAHFTASKISVSIADQDDLLAAGRAGLEVEEAAQPKTRGPRKPRD